MESEQRIVNNVQPTQAERVNPIKPDSFMDRYGKVIILGLGGLTLLPLILTPIYLAAALSTMPSFDIVGDPSSFEIANTDIPDITLGALIEPSFS